MLVMTLDNIIFRVGQAPIGEQELDILLVQEVEAGLIRHGIIEASQVMATQLLMLVQVVLLETRLVEDISHLIKESLGLGQANKLVEVVCSHRKYLLTSPIGDPPTMVQGSMWVIRQVEVLDTSHAMVCLEQTNMLVEAMANHHRT